jgi:hypothetical protein
MLVAVLFDCGCMEICVCVCAYMYKRIRTCHGMHTDPPSYIHTVVAYMHILFGIHAIHTHTRTHIHAREAVLPKHWLLSGAELEHLGRTLQTLLAMFAKYLRA